MREIKFRFGWNTLVHIDRDINPMGERKWLFEIYTLDQLIGSTDESMGAYGSCDEFTGHHDKNRKEIYEGDIVHGNHPSDFVIVPMLGGLSLLNINYFGQNHNELIAMPTNEAQTAGWLNECEVIGNIYENPELLKEAR